MPEWFEALNMEFRHQLTAIGAPGPNLYVAEEISKNRFRIAGGTPGGKVSLAGDGDSARCVCAETPDPGGGRKVGAGSRALPASRSVRCRRRPPRRIHRCTRRPRGARQQDALARNDREESMKLKLSTLIVVAGLTPVAAFGFGIRGYVMGNGGTSATPASNGVFKLYGTVGQPAIGKAQNGTWRECSGFWCFGGSRVSPSIPGTRVRCRWSSLSVRRCPIPPGVGELRPRAPEGRRRDAHRLTTSGEADRGCRVPQVRCGTASGDLARRPRVPGSISCSSSWTVCSGKEDDRPGAMRWDGRWLRQHRSFSCGHLERGGRSTWRQP